MSRGPEVDQRDLQGNVLCGYGNTFGHALYAFVRIEDDGPARGWLGELAERVTTALPWNGHRPWHTLNVALTCDGLRAAGVPDAILGRFPAEFRQGMAERAARLGDTGASAPTHWDPGLGPGEPQVLVTITARSAGVLAQRREMLRNRLRRPGSGLVLLHEQAAALIDQGCPGEFAREHFGFADGMGQPSIRGNAGPWSWPGRGTPMRFGRWRDVMPGEFVLGYEDEDGLEAEWAPEPLGRSGSFTVVRKLHQHVAAFTRFMREAAGGDPKREALLAAKVVGRWRDGTPLLPTAKRNFTLFGKPRLLERINDFRYESDRAGLTCPLGAHIRRANPRDGFGFQGRLTRRHRIIRRSMPYGTPPADPAIDDGVDRGLVFVCHQASIARGFELIQGRWLNDGDPFRLGLDKDFLAGAPDPAGKMTIQGDPPVFLAPKPAFVTTRGGGYFFTPGIGALRAIADAYWA